MEKHRWYVGISPGKRYQAFKATTTPTVESHGAVYLYAIGPFRTKRAALWVERFGPFSPPQFHTVNDAERLAR